MPLLVGARAVAAQAFLPPAGEGNVTAIYQNLHSRGHLDLNGDLMPGESGRDQVQAHSIAWGLEFGVSDRLAVTLSLPFIRAKYDGLSPHRPGGIGEPRQWDDGTYHGTFQDFQGGVRFRIASHPVTITPFVEAIIPSHHYPSIAHAAPGKDLRALVVGGAVAGFLDAIRPELFFQGQFSYAVAQEVLDIRPNRSRADAEIGYFITPRLSVRFMEAYQVTHHGIDVFGFTPMVAGEIHDHTDIPFTSDYRGSHDRLLRINYLTFGGGVGFALNDTLDVFAAGAKMVWGENVHPLRGFTVGANVHFRTRRAALP